LALEHTGHLNPLALECIGHSNSLAQKDT
jgi:hypothetical protein